MIDILSFLYINYVYFASCNSVLLFQNPITIDSRIAFPSDNPDLQNIAIIKLSTKVYFLTGDLLSL